MVSRSGYLFQLFLPADGGNLGHGTTEVTGGGNFSAPLNTDLCETTWCAYAAPANYGNSGNRTFFINQAGDITSKDAPLSPLSQGMAFEAGGHANVITGKAAVGTFGRDGARWRQVN